MNYERKEYPRPQFQREEWLNLNGKWTCHIARRPYYYQDADDSKHYNSKGFETEINVPFAPETVASGVNANEIINRIFYHRTIQIPSAWKDKTILLHFDAVFYHAEIYIDGIFVDFHDGGSSSFAVDITSYVRDLASHNLVVKVTANLQDGSIPSGKQSSFVSSYTCFYQRTTGIWQTVWLEGVDRCSLEKVGMIWNGSDYTLSFTPVFRHIEKGLILKISIEGVGEKEVVAANGITTSIKVPDPLLWEPGAPNLYNITYTVTLACKLCDKVVSYIGLRTIAVAGNMVYLNHKKLYQRLVLDQGFYPEGNWTAPSDQALKDDICLSMAAGFNGARLHQKVFEERFMYHADHLGYLLWAESPSWGLNYNDEALPARNMITEWAEIVSRDVNHPSVIAWTPMNETFRFTHPHAQRRLQRDLYDICRFLDPTRPVNDASGYIHFVTDLWTVHSYIQDPKLLKDQLEMQKGLVFRNFPDKESLYEGQPYLVDEYGGVKWDPETQGNEALSNAQNLTSWGYGKAPSSEEEFLRRVTELTEVLLSLPHICGYCYTQLTDVEMEKNGLYFYNRKAKFDMKKIKEVFSKKPDGYEL